ncbi:hypothetical protein CEP54_016061 [Fusarium duplospermum]|uniref:Zn(2)-C6 fungal-type domain-containing protein n=1 Tax=Fusarium duplospermum TaxID=1325734 RepID=A0A428NIM0_9HYPO|nr:hypothetical protein CEP54_016061 [Fusarium duplospermum]
MADDGGRLRSYGTPLAPSAHYYPKADSDDPSPGRMQPPAGQQPYPSPQLGHYSPAYPPLQGLRGGFCDDRRSQNPYFTQPYCQQPPPGFSPPPNGHQNCRDLAGGVYEMPQIRPSNLARVIEAAPRQRASIACQYCRKRKIRCSGYQSDPGGKCWNCAKVNRECIFQPLSSSGSIAFISVSAVPGGVAPGTRLPTMSGGYSVPIPSGCSPAGQNTASGTSTPARENRVQQSKNRSIMSLSNLVGSNGITRSQD